MDWNEQLHAFITLLAIVDPLGAVPFFLSFTSNIKERRREVAWMTALTVACILWGVVAGGIAILEFFHISLPTFQIAGGIILAFMALDMLQAKRGRTRHTPEEDQDAIESTSVAIIPLAMPLLAGPGAISSTMVLNLQFDTISERIMLAATCAAIALIVWLVFFWANWIDRYLSRTTLNMLTRILGLLLLAIAVGFIVEGIRVVLPGLA